MHVWIDLICVNSLFKLFLLSRSEKVLKVYYANTSIYGQFLLKLFGLFSQIVFEEIKDIALSELRDTNDWSVYETIPYTITKVLDSWIESRETKRQNTNFANKHDLNLTKLEFHIKEASFAKVYRSVELISMAQVVDKDKQRKFIFCRNPLSKSVREYFVREPFLFYSPVLSVWLPLNKRLLYFYESLNREYYSTRIQIFFETSVLWLADVFWSLISPSIPADTFAEKSTARIALEITQSRVKLDEINDLFFLQDSTLNTREITAFLMRDIDEETKRLLADKSMSSYMFVRNPARIAKHLLAKKSFRAISDFAVADKSFFNKTIFFFTNALLSLLQWGEHGWLKFTQHNFYIRKTFWQQVYKRYGIKIVYTMYDIDSEKLAKAQAVEDVNGIYTGGHWSNNQSYRIDNEKCYDVAFSWGSHFTRTLHLKYPFKAVFEIGYLSDHYFVKRRANAQKIREQYKGKFILTYMDNGTANDLPVSPNLQMSVYYALIGILQRHADVVLFMKPKRFGTLKPYIEKIPELKRYIDSGRIVLFLAESERVKYVPCEVGMASDCLIGLGVSTAVAECFFAGTMGHHIDLTQFRDNGFINNGLGKIAFYHVDDLIRAVEKRITGEDKSTVAEYKKYYSMLDPYQDGHAYRRMGSIIEVMHESLKNGDNRDEAVRKAQDFYNRNMAVDNNQNVAVG